MTSVKIQTICNYELFYSKSKQSVSTKHFILHQESSSVPAKIKTKVILKQVIIQ